MDIKDIQPGLLKNLGNPEMSLAKSKHESPEEVKKAATQFESLLVQQMLNAMWETVPKNEMLGSREEDMYRDMLNQAMADNIAENQTIGVRDVIAKDINRINEEKKEQSK